MITKSKHMRTTLFLMEYVNMLKINTKNKSCFENTIIYIQQNLYVCTFQKQNKYTCKPVYSLMEYVKKLLNYVKLC